MTDSDPEKKRAKVSEVEAFVNSLPFPLAWVLGAGYLFIVILGFLFGRGTQIYPVLKDIPPDVNDPECMVFDAVDPVIEERQFRIIYHVKTNLDLTKRSAWRLWRVKVHGRYFSEEVRASDNCGTYSMGPDRWAIHFNLIQEGPVIGELYCLDQLQANLSTNIGPWPRDTGHTVLHQNGGMSNVCLLPDQLIVFTPGWVTSGNVRVWDRSVSFVRMTIDHYSKEIMAFDEVVVFRYDREALDAMNTKAVMKRILLPGLVESQGGKILMFEKEFEFPPHFLSVLKRAANGKFTSEQKICVKRLIVAPDNFNMNGVNPEFYQMLRRLVSDKYTEKEERIVVNPSSQSEEIVRAIGPNAGIVSTDDIKSRIKDVVRSKVFVTFDDDNEVVNGLWLDPLGTVVMIHPPGRKKLSEGGHVLERAGKKIVYVEGEADGATSSDPGKLKDCIAGKLPSDSPECELAYRDITYRVDPKKVADAVAAIT
jgi:hypothetical protein